MIKALSICISTVLLVLSGLSLVYAQATEQNNLSKLLSDPSAFDSQSRVDIFTAHASQYYGTSLDSVFLVFSDMEQFGREVDDSLVIAMALSSQGSLAKMQGDRTKTLDLFTEAALYVENNSENALKNYAAIATTATYMGKYDLALSAIDKAFEIHRIVNNPANLGELHIVKGAYYESQSQFHSALTEYLKALDGEQYISSPLKVANIYLNISQMYHRLEDNEKSLEYLEPIESIVKANNYVMLANSLSLRRATYAMKNLQLDKARSYYLSSIDYLKEKNKINNLHKVYSNISIIETEKGNTVSAKKYLTMGLELLDSSIKESSRSTYCNAQYRYLQSIGRFEESKEPLNQILSLAEESNDYNKGILAFEGLVKAYEHEKNWEWVALYQRKILEYRKEQNVESQKNLIYDLESKYQNEQKEIAINSLQVENQLKVMELGKKKTENRVYIGLLLLAVLALIGLRYAYKSIQKINGKLSDTNFDLSKALNMNKLLLKEIHHRVKNNLQVVSSLLGLQYAYLKDPGAKEAIMTSKTRVQSMSLLHQKLYQGEDITKVNIKDYFENLTLNLFQTYKVHQDRIELHQNIEPLELDVDTVVTMGLIFNELISNSLKYAFAEGQEGAINVSVGQEGDLIRMQVSDDGVGVDFTELPKRSNSLGMNLVRSFTAKLNGEVFIKNDHGTNFDIVFPIGSVKV